MMFRIGLLVAVSVAAYTIRHLTIRTWGSSTSPTNCSEDGEDIKENDGLHEKEQKVNSICVNGSLSDLEGKDNLSEFRDLLSRESENPLFDANKKEDRVPETQTENNMIELERSLKLVKELEERKVKLEGELLMYHGLKDMKSDITELQKQLKIKNEEVDMLNFTISSLQAERKKLQEEIVQGALMKKELEVARSKIKELQRQLQLDANQTKQHLLLLKQQVSGLQAKEEEAVKKQAELHKKLKTLKDLEAELGELKTKNRELQHVKQELTIKLDVTEARSRTPTGMIESEMVIKEKEEAHKLRQENEDLVKQVEGLQTNRFSEVEELVYLRWVNACLRYELRNNQKPIGKISACDLNRSLSPKSKENAKQLMLEYAGLDFEEADTDPESNFSLPFSSRIEAFDNTSVDSSASRYRSLSEKPNLNLNMKKLSRRLDGSSAVPFAGVIGSTHRWKDPLEALIPTSSADSLAINNSGMVRQEIPESPEALTLSEDRLQVSSSDSLNLVATSFQLMSKSVQESLKDKYPAYKDHLKLASEREKQIKEKAKKARAEKFADISSVNLTCDEGTTVRERPAVLPPKLAQIKEKAIVCNSGSRYNENKNMITDPPIMSKLRLAEVEKRPPRVPRPPPRSTAGVTVTLCSNASDSTPSLPPISHPPPTAPLRPPLAGGPPCPHDPPGVVPRQAGEGNKVYYVPEFVQFYQTMMKREVKRDPSSSLSSTSDAFDATSSRIEEIENRSSFHLAVKADVETQEDFVMSLAMEVREASFSNMEDLISFVIWLDEELSFLVDERAVLKHFDWPGGKTEALREAASVYKDLMTLGEEVSSFVDNPKFTCEVALKEMYSLLDKVEQSVYALLNRRDVMISQYREFGIPVDWLLDSGVVGKIKLSSVELARKYMKRIVNELDTFNGPEKESNREFLLLQGVRFTFRVHQFAGGFDTESMKAFEELRSCVHTIHRLEKSNEFNCTSNSVINS